MNLHGVVRGAITAVNPDTIGTWYRSAGTYTTAPNGTRTPQFTAVPATPIQVQALSSREVAHIDALNIGGADRGVWVNGQLQAMNRVDQTGGDILAFDGKFWLVVALLESWDRPGWSHAAVRQQKSGPV